MSPIHPEIFRVGKTSRWFTDIWIVNKSSELIETTIIDILNGYLGDLYNLFVVKCAVIQNITTGSINVSVIFYKYIQRARAVKSRHMILLVASGIMEIKIPLYYVRQSQGFAIPAAMVMKMENLLQLLFGKVFHIQFFNLSQLAEVSSNKINARLMQILEQYTHTKQQAVERSRGKRAASESRLESNWINPILLRDSHRAYKSFSNMSYFLDLLMVILYTSVYSTSNLLADVTVRGLLRNMKRHKQFLNAIETIINHFRSFENWPYKPLDWCIGFHGKIGTGTARSRSYYIKTGFSPLQTMSFPVDYSYRCVDTKFGSIGVKVWLRRHAA